MDFIRWILHLPQRAAEIADRIDGLHAVVVSISFLGAAVVGLVAVWFAWHYRAGAKRHDPTWRLGWRFEVSAAVLLLVLFMTWWVFGWRIYRSLDQSHEHDQNRYTVHVVGKLWMWKFRYPNGRQTVNELVLPVDTPIHLSITSRDTIHSLFLPAFRLKRDAIPHATTHLFFTPDRIGEYQLLCAEYCGTSSHSSMHGSVHVLSQTDFSVWAEEQAAQPTLVEQGRSAALRHGCFSCHSIDGTTLIGPSWLGRYGETIALSDGEHVLVDDEYLTRSMMEPSVQVAAGFRDLMPRFLGLLPAADAAAIVTYIRSLQDQEQQPQERLEEATQPLRE